MTYDNGSELCVLDLRSTTQVVSRLHATVLGKSCVCSVNQPYQIPQVYCKYSGFLQ